MTQSKYICNDPSHPHIIQHFTQETLYHRILKKVDERRKAGLAGEGIVNSVTKELIPQLNFPSDSVQEGYRLQGMRRSIVRDWGCVFNRIDNLGYLTGWFINDCDREGDILHLVLCLFAREAIRNVFATVNQLRSALTEDTFGYWRTLYETLVKSRFILKYTSQDEDLPMRFLYYTNSRYLEFYRMFAPDNDRFASTNMWIEAEREFANRFPKKTGEGDYGWAHPLIRSKSNNPIKRPTFRNLIDSVDKGSKLSEIYYKVATSKTHGGFIWNPLMVRPEGRGTDVDPFSVGGIGLVLDLTLPVFKEILENTAPSCTTPEHAVVMAIARYIFEDLRSSVSSIKARDPSMHLGLDP